MPVPGARILIVDDAESDRLATRFLLEQKRKPSYVVAEVPQGSLAQAACERFHPDCVLLDFRMPDQDGLEVLKQLREQFGTLQFAVVLLTGTQPELVLVKALRSGAQDYIPKAHLTAELLERAIQNSLSKLTLEQQKQQAEEALAASERKLRHVIDSAPCALYMVDVADERSLYVSAYAESLIGYTAEEMDHLGGPGLLALIHAEDKAAVQAHVKKLRLAPDSKVLECEFRIRHKDETWRWILVSDRVVARDSKGLANVLAGSASDINHRRRMEDELRQSQAQLLVAQEAAGIGAWSWDIKGNKLNCSPLCLKLYGRTAEEAASNKIWGDWLHPDDRQNVEGELACGVKGEPFQAEFRVVWPDGSIHWLQSQGKLIEGAGRPAHFLGASLDVTEKKKAEEELRRSNEELERFAYVASHDLQEPLRTILSFSELFARRNKAIDKDSQQFLDYIRQGGQRMQALISDLLTFSRVTQAGHEPLEEVDGNEVLAEMLGALRALIQETGTQIKADPLPRLTANFQQLVQLLQNLVGNGIKYRGERTPVVRIACLRIPNGWQFCVADNGIGFDMIYAERIFEAFKRLHSRDQFSGTGLGLAICKRIVERHGGRIWAQSEPGVGSTFYFTITDFAAAI